MVHRQRSIDINGLHYCLNEYIPPERKAAQRARLVLLHGFTGSGVGWAAMMTNFARPALAPDLLGHGQTDAPSRPARYAMERAATDLAALLRMTGDGPVHLLGYSMGGRLALALALMHPELVSSLVLESASPGLADATARAERKAADDALATFIETEGVAAFTARWEKLPLFATQARLPATTRRALYDQRLRNRPQGLANSLRGMGTGVQPSLWPRLGELAMPTLLIVGAYDEKFRAVNCAMQAQIPAARLAIVNDAGHTVHLEQPAAFRTLVMEFLK